MHKRALGPTAMVLFSVPLLAAGAPVSTVTAQSSVAQNATLYILPGSAARGAAPVSKANSEPLAQQAINVTKTHSVQAPNAADDEARVPQKVPATEVIIKSVLGLAIVVLLAYLGARPRTRWFQKHSGVTHLIIAGFPFIALGLIARSTGVITETLLVDLTPLLQFGVGWIGFLVGIRFDVRFLDRLPRGTALAVSLTTALPFLFILLGCGWLMFAFSGPSERTLVRDAITLGTAGAMTAPRISQALPLRRASRVQVDLPTRIGQLDEIAGVIGMACLGAYFRPDNAILALDLPGTAWLFLTLGMGMAVGLVIYTTLKLRALTKAEFTAITLGAVAFCAGMAGYLHLSPLVVCFAAGAVVANLSFHQKERIWDTLTHLEGPILLLFMAMAGALWDVSDWRGWLLVPVFVGARVLGKWTALIALRINPEAERIPVARESHLVFAPQSVLSLAIVMDAQGLYLGSSLAWIVTAVIAGAFVNELIVQAVGTHPNIPRAGPDENPPRRPPRLHPHAEQDREPW